MPQDDQERQIDELMLYADPAFLRRKSMVTRWVALVIAAAQFSLLQFSFYDHLIASASQSFTLWKTCFLLFLLASAITVFAPPPFLRDILYVAVLNAMSAFILMLAAGADSVRLIVAYTGGVFLATAFMSVVLAFIRFLQRGKG